MNIDKKMKNIVLIGEKYGGNLGEPLLFECTEYLCKKCEPQNMNFFHADMFARGKVNGNGAFPLGIKVLNRVEKYLHIHNKTLVYFKEFFFNTSLSKIKLYKYLDKVFANADLIIIIGGGTIKYDVRLNFAPYYKAIIECAEKYSIPVFINCVGVESVYNPKDIRCRMFSNVLSNNTVKIVTTRDDIENLNKYIHNSNVETAKIADIGIWSSDVYGYHADKKSSIIGLGMITPTRFKEFKRGISKKQYETEWINIINRLDKRNDKWFIFNNGDTDDVKFAEYICRKLGKDPTIYVKTPKTPEELVKIVSGFKGIITSRLHSCIVAYSLDVPFVAISWNNKLKYFAENIGVERRIIESDRFRADVVIEEFDKSLSEGYDNDFKKKYKKTNIKYITQYLSYLV